MVIVDAIERGAAQTGIRIAQQLLQLAESAGHGQSLGCGRTHLKARVAHILEQRVQRDRLHIARAIGETEWQLPEGNVDFLLLAILAEVFVRLGGVKRQVRRRAPEALRK